MAMKVRSILATKSSEVITIGPAAPVRDAVKLLEENNIGALVVMDGERPVGILSERDIIRRAASNEGLFGEPVRELMTHQLITGLPQDDIYSVMHTMTEKRFRHLPILDEGRLIGIVSIGDLLKAQRDTYQGEIDTLETQLLADEE